MPGEQWKRLRAMPSILERTERIDVSFPMETGAPDEQASLQRGSHGALLCGGRGLSPADGRCSEGLRQHSAQNFSQDLEVREGRCKLGRKTRAFASGLLDEGT